MKIGNEDRTKLIAAGSFGVLAVGYLVYTLAGGSSSDAPTPAPVTVVTTSRQPPAPTAAPTRSSASSRLDPTLHPEGMLLTEALVYSGSGRNIFLPANAVTAPAAIRIPTPLATARYVPPTTGPVGPPPVAPIDLRFFGTSTSRDGKRQAFLLRGEDVFIASPGEIVNRRYRVGAITLTSVEVTDLSTNNSQQLSMSPQ